MKSDYLVLFRTTLFTFYSFGLLSSQVTAKLLNKKEGDVCRQGNGVGAEHVCVLAEYCQPLIDSIELNAYHRNAFDLCSFFGKEAIVCCPPTADRTVPEETRIKNSISADEKCRQYTEFEYRKPHRVRDDVSWPSAVAESGSSTKRNVFPHMALLGYGHAADEPEWGCGGSLISEKWILTAAHCLRMGSLNASWARLGISNVHENVGEDHRIVQHVAHHGYRPASRYYDVALLRLEKHVKFSENVKPICLNSNQLLNPRTQIATSWGRASTAGLSSDELLRVELNIVPAEKCNSSYFPKSSLKQLELGITPESMICVGSAGGVKNTCLGDTGGPLQTKNIGVSGRYTGLYTQFGIASFGKLCSDNDVAGVYTRVSKYVSWIEDIVWPV